MNTELAARLWQLTNRLCNQTLSADEQRELEALLRASPDARDFVVDVLHQEGEVQWLSGATRQGEVALDSRPAEPEPAAPILWRSAIAYLSQPLQFGLFVASVATVSLALFFAQIPWSGASRAIVAPTFQEVGSAKAVARLTDTRNCVWVGAHDPARMSRDLPPGAELMLQSGLAEITFHSGARILLEGPTHVMLQAEKMVRLERGKLIARIDQPRAKGFTVVAAQATLVDLGTEFGVELDDAGALEVHVFEGTVEATVARSTGPQTVVLTQRQALRVAAQSDAAAGIIVQKAAQPARFTRVMAPDRPAEPSSRQVIEQAPGADYLAWEAEDYERNEQRSANLRGWLAVRASAPIVSPRGQTIPPPGAASGDAALIANFELGSHNQNMGHDGRVTYRLRFREEGAYHLYLRMSLYPWREAKTEYGEADSLFVPQADRRYGWSPPTFLVWNLYRPSLWPEGGMPTDGRYAWYPTPTSEQLPVYEIQAAQLAQPLRFQFDTREAGLSLDRVVISRRPDLADEELDQMKNSPQITLD